MADVEQLRKFVDSWRKSLDELTANRDSLLELKRKGMSALDANGVDQLDLWIQRAHNAVRETERAHLYSIHMLGLAQSGQI